MDLTHSVRLLEKNGLLHRLIAHRGLFDNIRTAENTLDAFAKAMSLDFPIELDTHITADGVLVVFHDDNLKRMTGVDRQIADCTFGELLELRLKSTDCSIPTLEQVLKLVDNQVPLLIELKYDTPVGRMEAPLLEALRSYEERSRGRFAVQSFDPLRMKWFYDHAPDIPRGQLVSDFSSQYMFFLQKLALRHMWLNLLSRPHFISANLGILGQAAIRRQRQKGRLVFGWTARSQQQLDHALPCCDSVIFDSFLPARRNEMDFAPLQDIPKRD